VRALIAAAMLTAIVLTLLLVPADVKIRARGELQPAERQEVFAPRDGIVTAVHVDHGQFVTSGQTLLEMRSSELDLELQQARGELDTTRQRLAAAQSERLQIRPGDADARLRGSRLTAEEEQLQQQAAALEEREKMLRGQLDQLTVIAPVAGQVLTWNAGQRLASRPLRRGDALLTVANVEGPWQVELKVPSRQAGRLLKARQSKTGGQQASIALTTAPGEPLAGTISHVASRAQIDEAGETYVLVTVDLPRERLAHRVPGATAVARISCGRGSLGEAWFHDLTDAVRLWLPF
jgi:multidrug efflux pump subunit AcrA (membrane-fusion protein)